MSAQRLWQIAALLSVLHFAYYLFRTPTQNFAQAWNQESCVLRETGAHVDGENCRYFHTRAVAFAQPWAQGEAQLPRCILLSSDQGKTLFEQQALLRKEGVCADPTDKAWGTWSFNTPEIGWDAVSIWYARALAYYYQGSRAQSGGECSWWMSCALQMFWNGE